MIDPKPKKAPIVAPTRLKSSGSGLSTSDVNGINSVSAFNTKRRGVEAVAKTDSIAAAKKSAFNSKDLVDQRRAGNAAANVTRAAGGNPAVSRGRTYTGTSSMTDKYAPDGSKPSVDFYSRNKPLEKDFKRKEGGSIEKPAYGSDKINVGSNGLASAKQYPRSRASSIDKRSGKEMITITDSNKKILLHKENAGVGGAKESNKFINDSTAYSNAAKYQEEKFNIGKVASKSFRPKPVVKSKKGAKMVDTKDAGYGCSAGKMQTGGALNTDAARMGQASMIGMANSLVSAKKASQRAKPKQPIGGYNTTRGNAGPSAAEQVVRSTNSRTPGMYARGGEMPSIDEESPIRHNR